ncbi:TPA: hypothetical protein ACMD15_003399 [Vibrio cholerae]
MAIGVFGSPLKDGKSGKSEAARFSDVTLKVGHACTFDGFDENGNTKVKPFDGESFFGFVSANDFNKKHKTCSVQRSGYMVPVVKDGTVTVNEVVGLDASGRVVDSDTATFIINGSIRIAEGKAVDNAYTEQDCAVIDFELGGAKKAGG